MGRKSKTPTQHLTESILGQHLALSVAAHLARTQLVPDPLSVYDAQHISDMVDAVSNALLKVAPIYVNDTKGGTARELAPVELEGAVVRRGATVLALKDGRKLTIVSMKRADLRQAIAILKAVGVPGLGAAPPPTPEKAAPGKPALAAHVAELESLLRLPLIAPHVEKANAIAVAIARHARYGRVANLAMQLISAVHEARDADREGRGGVEESRRVSVALARLRDAAEEAERSAAAGDRAPS
jgi:hypothetical protein